MLKYKNTNTIKKRSLSLSGKILISLLVGILVYFVSSVSILTPVDNLTSDVIYQHDSVNDLPITIVMIDEDTINELGQYTGWSREIYADFLNRFSENNIHPAAIAFDVLFTGSKDFESDTEFAKAAERCGNVIVGMSLEYDTVTVEKAGNNIIQNDAHVKTKSLPYDELANVCTLAYVKNSVDPFDNYARTLITGINVDGKDYDSLGLAALKKYMEYKGTTFTEYDSEPQKEFRFTYTGGPMNNDGAGPFNYISFADIVSGRIVPDLSGEIVLVGGYANAFGDSFFVPSARGETMYGVEIHANIIEALYEGKLQKDINKSVLGAVYGILSAALVYVLLQVTLLWGAVISISIIALGSVIGKILYNNGLYCGLSMMFLSPVIIYFGIIIYQYFAERAVKHKISKAFKMYVAPQIVEEVAAEGSYELQLGGRNKDIAVLFVDIRGFTTMSESLKPEQVVEILNEYFAIITDAIFKNGGTLDKFIGDAAMAVFNSPFDLDDYVFKAVKTGWDIASGSKILQERLLGKYGKTVSYGVGVNCGEAVIGNIGCEFRMDYTAIGDTVNTASRLESNAKAGQILISEEVYSRIKDRVEIEGIGEIPLKGKKNGVFVYNVINIL